MLNEIMDAVTRKLDELFPDCRIYTDGVEQGLEEPCFFVGFLEPSEKPMIGQRYFRQMGLSIQYLPGDEKGASRRINQTADILMDGMEYITLEDESLVRGTGRTAKPDMEQSVLTFLVDYNMFVIKPREAEPGMEHMETRIGKE